jgi:predicted amidophosphoribosyltransferase
MLLGWRCPVCGAAGAVPCAKCRAALRPSDRVPAIEGVDWCAALLAYRGAGRELVARAKFRNQRAGLAWLGRGMAEVVRESGNEPALLTWAPADPGHVRSRGFDHGELLAKHVARALGVPRVALLERTPGLVLTGLSAGDRAGGPPIAPRRLPSRAAVPLCGATVLVVDDVVTTGATLRRAAAALRSIGAARVLAVTAAHTPAPTARV